MMNAIKNLLCYSLQYLFPIPFLIPLGSDQVLRRPLLKHFRPVGSALTLIVRGSQLHI